MSGAVAQPRVGVLSFAHYHANFWSEVFAGRGLLEGIWDDDAARGAEAAARFGVGFEDDLEHLLSRCTAVAICSETSRHPFLVERASAAGVAVLVEKPLAVSVAEGQRIADLVARSSMVFMQSFPKRFDPVSSWLKSLVDERTLGTLSLVRIRHGHYYGLDDAFRHRWYVQQALSGGGALIDEGVHGADLLAWLFGMPDSVTAVTSHSALGLEVEDLAVATFVFPDGLVAELTASFCFAAADASIELYGSKGTALVSGVDLASRDITQDGFVRIYRHDGTADTTARRWTCVPLTPRFKRGEFHHQNALAFVDCLEHGRQSPITVDDGLRALRMIEAAYDAARTGCRQQIPT